MQNYLYPHNNTMKKLPTTPRRRLVWKVRITMAERGVRTVTELAARLGAIGVTISISQLGRLIDGKSKLINPEILEGLMTVLDCGLEGVLAEAAAPETSRRK